MTKLLPAFGAVFATLLPLAAQEVDLDFHVVGTRSPTTTRIPGIAGILEVSPMVFASRAALAAALASHPEVGGLKVQQVISRPGSLILGPGRTVRSLLDGDMPLHHIGGLPELEDTGEAVMPETVRVTLRLASTPIHSNFTRWLRFRDDDDNDAFLELAFTNDHDLVWTAALPAGVAVLEDFVTTGERSHWDRMALVNRGGTTSLDIARLTVEIDYEVTNYRSGTFTETITIPLVDRTINRVLDSGSSVIPLNTYAQLTRRNFAGVDSSYPAALLDAIDDLGKSGSDGGGTNPKYGAAYELLCSEFVSWYYHENGVSIIPLISTEFRDITGTQQMHDLFRSVGRLYRYHSGSSHQRFEDPDTGAVYTPGPGDFLEWRKNGAAMHAMMLLSYDSSTKVATVVNGPWPVRLMEVDLQWWEASATSAEFDFWIGKIR
ncbi:MAG: hypothetical protein KDC98_08220 [Planctomycetes bacterium]|nr:hypothetical protein [Planctomycetota bacterium]